MGELVVVQKAYWVPSMDKNTHQMNPKMPRFLGSAISGLGKGKFCFVGVHPINGHRKQFVRLMVSP